MLHIISEVFFNLRKDYYKINKRKVQEKVKSVCVNEYKTIVCVPVQCANACVCVGADPLAQV